MPVAVLPRSAWASVDRPTGKLTPNDASVLRGFAVHWPGSPGRRGDTPSLTDSTAELELERKDHVLRRGWSDIAYSWACDQAGRLFDCRGTDYRCAANGDQTVNQRYAAITCLIGADDTPTPALIEAVQWWRSNVWLRRWPHAVGVVGHRDLYSTDCPGDRLYQLVKAGTFTHPPTSGGNDVALTQPEIDAVAYKARDLILGVTYGTDTDGTPYTLGKLWGELRINVLHLLQGSPVALSQTQVDALASAVVDRIGPQLADQLAQSIAARIANG
jgi:hypothetical protein